jgi:hypothetical protein
MSPLAVVCKKLQAQRNFVSQVEIIPAPSLSNSNSMVECKNRGFSKEEIPMDPEKRLLCL